MVKLSSRARRSLPSSTFAMPGRKFPIPDRSHAQNALARASQKGGATKKRVDAKVAKKFPGLINSGKSGRRK